MRVDPVKLIQFIVCQATEFGTSLTPIRVIKFLYLADLYHARENNGQTLTEWPWAFVYFGPYCTASIKEIIGLRIETRSDGQIATATSISGNSLLGSTRRGRTGRKVHFDLH